MIAHLFYLRRQMSSFWELETCDRGYRRYTSRIFDAPGHPPNIVSHDAERVHANTDADHGDRGIGHQRHGVLPVLAPLASFTC